MGRVNIAVLGTGNIARKMVKAMKETSAAAAYAVASRNSEKARAFADEYGIPQHYGSYEEALADERVSLVYIATPHPFHYEWIKNSLLAGKHVLCEKPITVNARQAQELFALAQERGVLLCEAMWTRFLPAVAVVKELLASGCIGKPLAMNGSIGYDSTAVRRMTDPSYAGGILLDCGIYLLTSMVLLFGDDITSFDTEAVLSEQGVDLHSTTRYRFADGKTACLDMAMDALLDNRIVIEGEHGTLTFDTPFYWERITVRADGKMEMVDIPSCKAGGWEYMLDCVCQTILSGKTVCRTVSPDKTIAVMRLMDSLRERWGLRYPFE